MIYSLFYRHNSSCTIFWVSSFHLSVNNVVWDAGVVPIHGPWSRISKTSHLKLKREVSRTEKKRLKIAIMFSGRRRRSREKRNGFVKADVVKKCSFTCTCGIFLPLNPSTNTVYARYAFYPSLRCTLSLQSAFYPWSAVCGPQSAVYVLH